MRYVRMTNSKVVEIIHDPSPAFPGVPLSRRYSSNFLASLIPVGDDVEVQPGWAYDPETGRYEEPQQEAAEEAEETGMRLDTAEEEKTQEVTSEGREEEVLSDEEEAGETD